MTKSCTYPPELCTMLNEQHLIFALNKIKIAMTHEYQVSGMTCQGCAASVKNLLRKVPGVKNVDVSLEHNKATIEMDHHITTDELNKAFDAFPKYAISEIEKVTTQHIDYKHIQEDEDTRSFWDTYKPIIVVFAYLTGLTLLVEFSSSGFDFMRWMRHFMAGFFLVFSFFKMLDLPSFASSYSTYDIVAKKWYGWGFIYPFVELILGLLFLTNIEMLLTNVATFIIMGVSTIGVLQSLLKKRKIRCACLGAVFNLPMSTVTLIEDLLMVGMSAVMIFYYL